MNENILNVNHQSNKNLCKKISGLIASQLLAVTVSAASVTLYFLSTSGQPSNVRISSIGSNFVMNWFLASESIKYFSSSENGNIKIFKKFIIAFLSANAAIPYAVAAYNYTEGSESWKIGASAIDFIGTTSLFLYPIMKVLENDCPYMINLASSRIRSIFCLGNDEERKYNYAINLLQKSIIKQIEEGIKLIKQEKIRSLSTQDCFSDEDTKILLNKISKMIPMSINPVNHNKSSFWKSSVGVFLSGFKTGVGNSIKLAVGSALILGSFGYLCDMRQTLENTPFFMETFLAWNISNIVMLPLNYLAGKGGINETDKLFNLFSSIMRGEFIRSKIWKSGGKYFGFPLQFVSPLYSLGLAWQSAYTSINLYDKCPGFSKFNYSKETVNYSTVIFNAIYVNYGIEAAVLSLIYFFGSKRTKLHMDREEISVYELEKIKKMSSGDFLKYAEKFIFDMPDSVIERLVGKEKPEDDPVIEEDININDFFIDTNDIRNIIEINGEISSEDINFEDSNLFYHKEDNQKRSIVIRGQKEIPMSSKNFFSFYKPKTTNSQKLEEMDVWEAVKILKKQ